MSNTKEKYLIELKEIFEYPQGISELDIYDSKTKKKFTFFVWLDAGLKKGYRWQLVYQ